MADGGAKTNAFYFCIGGFGFKYKRFDCFPSFLLQFLYFPVCDFYSKILLAKETAVARFKRTYVPVALLWYIFL